MPDWLQSLLKIAATAAVAAGAGGLGMHQFDGGAPERAEAKIEELRIEAGERQAMRERCDRQLTRAHEETRHFVERCVSLATGGE